MARPKALRKINSDDREISKLENYLEQFLGQFSDSDIISGLLLRKIALTTGQLNTVEHKLNRPILGYVVTRKNTDSSVWDEQDSNLLPGRTINLQCSADVTVDLWVF